MGIPPALVEAIKQGEAALFLGSGASRDAKDALGNPSLTGKELGVELAERFLGGQHSSSPLQEIADFAINEGGCDRVHEYIRQRFENLEPTDAHKLIPDFRWYGIATTNYDLLVERAYRDHVNPIQDPVPFISDDDALDARLRNPKSMPFIKLHGCITRSTDPRCPLILSTDTYINHKENRLRIFNRFTDWGYEHPILFVGHSLADMDIRLILNQLTDLGVKRPPYYLVLPDIDDIAERFWNSRRVFSVRMTFSQLMCELSSHISSSFSRVIVSRGAGTPAHLLTFPVPLIRLSDTALEYLATDLEYVGGLQSLDVLSPRDFYRGLNKGWTAIQRDYDVRRGLEDDILLEHLIDPVGRDAGQGQIVLIKGHAGAGKSILLRRIAWSATNSHGCTCLFLREDVIPDSSALLEIVGLSSKHVYLFVDGVVGRVKEIVGVLQALREYKDRFTVIACERINEWNVACEALKPFTAVEYELGYLKDSEIGQLINLLEQYDSLGVLKSRSFDERRAAFKERAGRQLLVALHEATHGKTFEEIVADEYRRITPLHAQIIYRTICVLNRLGVPVRAGLVSRVHGVTFEDFKERFLGPLEGLVHATYNKYVRDMEYRARHPAIAQMVFDRILTRQEDRYDAYLTCLKGINISYESDRTAFYQMTKARSIMDLFSNEELSSGVFREAEKIAPRDTLLMHQRAIYEFRKPDSNFNEAAELLATARAQSPRDHSLKHSTAELALERANKTTNALERERFLREVDQIAQELIQDRPAEVHSYHTLVKSQLLRLESALSDTRSRISDSEIQVIVSRAEEVLSLGEQRFPENEHLLDSEARLASMLRDSDRCLRALEAAFERNPRNVTIASRLALLYSERGDSARAKTVFEESIRANPNERRLHFGYARLLISQDCQEQDILLYHLRLSFSPGDQNHRAKLLYARQLYLAGEYESAADLFRELSKANVSYEMKIEPHYPVMGERRGRILRKESRYCIIVQDSTGQSLFCHADQCLRWPELSDNMRVRFILAFSFRGPRASNVEPE